MDELLGFFSDLILFTAGLIVAIFWFVVIIAIVIEVKDLITGEGKSTTLDMDEEDF